MDQRHLDYRPAPDLALRLTKRLFPYKTPEPTTPVCSETLKPNTSTFTLPVGEIIG